MKILKNVKRCKINNNNYATVRSVVSELIIETDLQSSGRIQYCTNYL